MFFQKFANNKIIILLCLLLFFVFFSELSFSQSLIRKKKVETTPKTFPDNYSELDDIKIQKKQKDDVFNQALESSKQKYFQALILIQKGDTVGAATYFEDALDKINKLSSYPNIENNTDFMDLAQSIIDDYETFVKNTKYIDENSSVFVVKELLFKEVETIKGPQENEIKKPIVTDKPKNPKKNLIKNKIFIPDTFQIELTDNTLVQKNIAFLTSRGKKAITKWLERSTRWMPMLNRIAIQEKMPPEIMFLAMVESGLNPNAVSKANAVGMWQFIRTTGEMYELNDQPSYWIDERRDPEKATLAAMRHLKDLYNELGDWHLALAAYNCGMGGVSRAIRKSRKESPNFWDLSNLLPKETSNYVPAFIATTKIACDPESFGFDLDSLNFLDDYKYDIFEIRGKNVNLECIAKSANITLEQLKDLNPELLKSCTPPDVDRYYVKIPYGTMNLVASNFAKLSEEEKSPFISHYVREGENIASIAKLYKISKDELVYINKFTSSKQKLPVDSAITIPISKYDFDKLKIDLSKPIIAETRDEEESPKPVKKSVPAKTVNKTHIVATGETLFNIARTYGIDVAMIRKLNNLKYNNDKIQVGQELILSQEAEKDISSDEEEDSQPTKTTKTIKYTVKKNETLYQIADKFDVSKADIKSWNNLKKNTLKKGQKLKIKITEEEPVSKSNAKSNNKNTLSEKHNQKESQNNFSNSKFTIHKVKKGESLEKIAKKYDVSEDQIKEWNPDEINGSSIYANSKLKIYHKNSEPITSNKNSDKKKQKENNQKKYYKIKDGDTLGEIAKKFNTTISQLKSFNKNLKENNLKIGQQIRIN